MAQCSAAGIVCATLDRDRHQRRALREFAARRLRGAGFELATGADLEIDVDELCRFVLRDAPIRCHVRAA
jgi:hypothetical protein